MTGHKTLEMLRRYTQHRSKELGEEIGLETVVSWTLGLRQAEPPRPTWQNEALNDGSA